MERREQGLGAYNIDALRIDIGDSTVEVVPLGRNVIGYVNLPGGGEIRAAGRVDITSGVRKFHVYRTMQDGKDVWYVADEQYKETLLTRQRFEEVLMDLMS